MKINFILLSLVFLSVFSSNAQSNNDLGGLLECTFEENAFGQYHGYGKLVWLTGDSYIGYMENGKYAEFGNMIWVSGVSYEGEWKNDMMHGYGKLSWVDGTNYIGNFALNNFHGVGILTDSSGKFMKGIWENGEFLREQ